jgi:integrase
VKNTAQAPGRSTWLLLGKNPSFPNLYRHSVNGTYYAMKEIVGKRKEHSLETSDRKLAERRFKDWAANLNKVDTEAEKTTLAQLVDKFKNTREGLAFKTRKTDQWILGTLEEDWAYGWSVQVSRIRVEKRNAEAEDSANFIEFMGLAGLSQAEASSLKWGDLNWEKGQLCVRRHKTRELLFPPIYPDLLPFLKKLHSKHPTPPSGDTLIFRIRDARKALCNACQRLKYPPFT